MSQENQMQPMRFKNLMQQSVFKKYFTLSLLALLALAIGIVYLWQQQYQYKKQLLLLELQQVQAQKEKLLLLQLFELDEQVIFSGDYEQALSAYEALYPQLGEEVQGVLAQRIENIKQLIESLNNENQEDVNKDLLLAERKRQIQELNTSLDSLQSSYANTLQQAQVQSQNLREELSKKERALNRKERLQVLTFAGQKGAKIHYLGEVENGKANGGGIGIWTTGSIYRGEWKDNKRQGKGTFEWADGEKYEGDYNNDIREGQGTYYWPSGERYEGGWANNMRQGEGKLFDKDGNISYSGLWDKDKPVK